MIIGIAVITYHCIAKPLGYLDELLGASEQLIRFAEEPITLSPVLKTVEDELNLVREQALRNAMLAREAEQRKNDLLVYLAHDLKTPLTSVLGYLTLLKDEPQLSDVMRARYTGIALDKAERLETSINEFFEITRFNLTTLMLEPETIHLSRMLEQIAYEFQPVLEEKNLHWTLQIAPDSQLTCDAEKLERVLDNLIRNAIHYSYPHTNIALSLQSREDGVFMQIENHGKTIPAEKLEHIFEQFFRVDTARDTTTGGAGLGLAIAKEIVALHGGTITAESADELICFTVWLPLHCQKIV